MLATAEARAEAQEKKKRQKEFAQELAKTEDGDEADGDNGQGGVTAEDEADPFHEDFDGSEGGESEEAAGDDEVNPNEEEDRLSQELDKHQQMWTVEDDDRFGRMKRKYLEASNCPCYYVEKALGKKYAEHPACRPCPRKTWNKHALWAYVDDEQGRVSKQLANMLRARLRWHLRKSGSHEGFALLSDEEYENVLWHVTWNEKHETYQSRCKDRNWETAAEGPAKKKPRRRRKAPAAGGIPAATNSSGGLLLQPTAKAHAATAAVAKMVQCT